jgi:hypothetical protein
MASPSLSKLATILGNVTRRNVYQREHHELSCTYSGMMTAHEQRSVQSANEDKRVVFSQLDGLMRGPRSTADHSRPLSRGPVSVDFRVLWIRRITLASTNRIRRARSLNVITSEGLTSTSNPPEFVGLVRRRKTGTASDDTGVWAIRHGPASDVNEPVTAHWTPGFLNWSSLPRSSESDGHGAWGRSSG